MSKCILIVDDEADVLRTVVFRLQGAGYEVLIARDGQEALDQLEQRRPDLILLDLRLPRIDGAEVCQRIKKHPTWKSIPVILLTASSHVSELAKVKEIGADDCEVKPFDWKILLKKIVHYLGRPS